MSDEIVSIYGSVIDNTLKKVAEEFRKAGKWTEEEVKARVAHLNTLWNLNISKSEAISATMAHQSKRPRAEEKGPIDVTSASMNAALDNYSAHSKRPRVSLRDRPATPPPQQVRGVLDYEAYSHSATVKFDSSSSQFGKPRAFIPITSSGAAEQFGEASRPNPYESSTSAYSRSSLPTSIPLPSSSVPAHLAHYQATPTPASVVSASSSSAPHAQHQQQYYAHPSSSSSSSSAQQQQQQQMYYHAQHSNAPQIHQHQHANPSPNPNPNPNQRSSAPSSQYSAQGRMPQYDGGGDEAPAKRLGKNARNAKAVVKLTKAQQKKAKAAAEAAAAQAKKKEARKAAGEEDDDSVDVNGAEEPELNSDDDDSDVAVETTTDDCPNLILCQYDQILHSKDRWKVSLRDGIMNINGRDYAFKKATGEFSW